MAIAPQFRKLFESCREMEFSHLRPLVDRMFENADVALLDFAEKAQSNMAQALFFEAMGEVRKKRSALEQTFFKEVGRSFAEFPVKPVSSSPATTDPNAGLAALSLVDTEELETTVAVQNAANKLTSRIMDRIFALKQRLSIVNDGQAIEEGHIPGGPVWLASAFQQAIGHLDLENKVRLVMIALFEKYVLNNIEPLYDEFNKRLIEADVLPNLKYEVRKQPGGIEIIEKIHVEGQETTETGKPVGADDARDVPQTPSELGDELFGRICELMSGRRTSQGTGGSASKVTAIHGRRGGDHAPPGGTASAATGAGAYEGPMGELDPAYGGSGGVSALLPQISNLQSQIQSRNRGMSGNELIENIEVDHQLIEKLQNTLAEEREKIFGAVDRRKLPAADTNVIELVGMLFEFMLKEENLPNLVKALLSRLHTPLLKVAVLDRRFFTQTQHPARKLLNDMTSAGIRWVDENQLERGIFPKMKQIVDQVLIDFQEDVSVFDRFLEEFEEAVQELKQRAKLIEQRATEAANGQDKLQAARSRAQEEVTSLLAGKPVAEEAKLFFRRIWADKLTFILLRNKEGSGSDEWCQAMDLAGWIIESCVPPDNARQREKRELMLVKLQKEVRGATQSLQQPDKEKLVTALFEAQKAALDQSPEVFEPEHVSVDGATTDDGAAPAATADTVDAAHSSLTPEQLAMIEKLKSINFGTWFEFSKDNGQIQRAKLSWRSTITEKFMFVDQMGVKAAVVSMYELADCMLNGKVRIVKAEKKPFVDRALSAIHRMLDHGARETARA